MILLQTKGELHPERKEAFEKAQKAYEKLVANTSSLAVSTCTVKVHNVQSPFYNGTLKKLSSACQVIILMLDNYK